REDRFLSFYHKTLEFWHAAAALRRKPLPHGCPTRRHLASISKMREEVHPWRKEQKKPRPKLAAGSRRRRSWKHHKCARSSSMPPASVGAGWWTTGCGTTAPSTTVAASSASIAKFTSASANC